VPLGIRHGRACQDRPLPCHARRGRARPAPVAADGQERRSMPRASSDAGGCPTEPRRFSGRVGGGGKRKKTSGRWPAAGGRAASMASAWDRGGATHHESEVAPTSRNLGWLGFVVGERMGDSTPWNRERKTSYCQVLGR
jgi:hypothetical protein